MKSNYCGICIREAESQSGETWNSGKENNLLFPGKFVNAGERQQKLTAAYFFIIITQ